MTTRSPCLAEQWFINDTIASLDGLCALCRSNFEDELRLFGADNKIALQEIYHQSRVMRVQAVKRGDFDKARDSDNWAALSLLRTIRLMISMAGPWGVRT